MLLSMYVMCIGVYYVNISAEFLKALLFGDLEHTDTEHCNVAWLVSVALTQALSLCTVRCVFHDGVIVSGVEGENCMLKAN